MPHTAAPKFRKSLIALAVGTALSPSGAWAVDLVQSPPLPTSKSAFVAPNVIISVDDSGSMKNCSNAESETSCPTTINNSKRTSKTNYSCASGYTLDSSNNCYKQDNTKRSVSYSCSNGYTLNSSNNCVKNGKKDNDYRTTNYSCSGGYTLDSSNNCTITDNTQRTETITYSCGSGQYKDQATNNCYDTSNATEETTPPWKQTSRRINVLKYALKNVFNDSKLIPDGKIRIAWQAMWNNGGAPGVGPSQVGNYNIPTPAGATSVDSDTLGTNSMRPIDTKIGAKTHRENFITFVDSLSPNNGTPAHRMFSQADNYMRRKLSSNGPWSSSPGGTGTKSTEYLGCRRNYHIMMTDGRWTGTATGGQQDGIDWIASGNRKTYSITSDQTQIYRDNEESTLADWAFKSWADPLQPASSLTDADKLKTSLEYDSAPDTENFTNGKKSVNLQKYWNPKYNPATWPHMVTYTIGFSDSAIKWPGAPTIELPTLAPKTSETDLGGYVGYDKGFIDLVTGSETWPTMNRSNTGNETVGKEVRSLDLWHAAINGRGRFYPVTEAADLENAFRTIIGKINQDSAQLPEKILSGGGTTGYSVAQNNAGLFSTVYEAKKGWKGYVMATSARPPEEYACPTKDDPNKTCFRFQDAVADWKDSNGVAKTTADRLDAKSDKFFKEERLVLTWNDELNKGVPFKWASDANYLSAAQKASIGVESTASGATVKTKGENILNFIRGDMTLQGKTEDKPFRERESRQGDIVNSEIWYTGNASSLPMLYVGGNDGMLHGFSAKNGEEKIAYVPRGVIPDLKKLADPDYTHRYYVDGSPMTGNIKDGSTDKTMLVGTLGAGGKGYFVLDVTNPATFSESGAASIVQIDRTRPNCDNSSAAKGTALCNTETDEEKDIGNITAQPTRNPNNLLEALQISRMNNGRWAAVLGNGYNSTNQRPVLLIQYLDGTSKDLVRIQTTTKTYATCPKIGTPPNDKVDPTCIAVDNGLASPTLVDLNGDGTVDIVYAGDNQGNLWKFDLTSDTPSDWSAQWGTENPLFTARGPKFGSTTRDQVQPITAPPIAEVNDRRMEVTVDGKKTEVAIGGMMVAFGTGRNLTAEDRRTDINQNVQTLYSVLDNTRYQKRAKKPKLLQVHQGTGEGDCSTSTSPTCVPAPKVVGTSPLAKQTIATVEGDYATVNATQELTKTTWKDYKGWYLDLPGAGERILRPMQFYDGSNILAVYSQSPAGTKSASSDNINESCVDTKVDTSAGSQWRTLVNIMDGKRPTVQLVDINGDNIFSATDDKNVNRIVVNEGTPVLVTDKNNVRDYTGQNTEGGKPVLGARMPEISVRPGWRQLN